MIKEKINLSGVNETMLVPVYARALESQKKNPTFFDEAAIKIINSLDYDFKQHGKNKMNMWGCAARTIILDRETAAYIEKHPNCSVVNIACGLDARFYRIDNGKIHWYNIDFHDRVTNISSSALDFSWLEKVQNKDNVLIIAEGVLMYLKESEVKSLFETISASFNHCAILCELMSKWMVKNQKMHDTIKKTNAVFQWGVNNSEDFTNLCPMYKMLRDYNLTDTMKQFSPIFMSLMSLMMRSKNNRISYFEKSI